MPFLTDQVPSLLGGVSQQPATLRFPTQAEAQVNAWPSESEGLTKRPPLEHIEWITTTDASTMAAHWINRDTAERYCVVAKSGLLRVFKLDGTECPVYGPTGTNPVGSPTTTYITAAPSTLKFLTVADYTFIANPAITCALESAVVTADTLVGHCYIYIRTGHPKATYSVTFKKAGGTAYTATCMTDYGFGASPVTTEIHNYKVEDIAANLAANISAINTTNSLGLTITATGPIIKITHASTAIEQLDVWDQQGNNLMVAFNREIDYFEDLPTRCTNGYVVRVRGDSSAAVDDKYVKFVADTSGTGVLEGHWEETVAQGVTYQLDADTMPQQLTKHEDTPGTVYFRLQPVTWIDRVVGDATTNPSPGFIGKKITELFFHRNRLGFLAGQSVIMSEASRYFNFWRTTVSQVIDSDPIDATAQTPSKLFHAVSHNEKLFLFSDRQQFVLDGEPLLTPKTVSIEAKSAFQTNSYVRPLAVGNNIAFVFDRVLRTSSGGYSSGSFAGVRELYVSSDTGELDAVDITSHVPNYIAKTPVEMVVNIPEGALVVRTSEETNGVWVYKWFDQGNERVQSAWFKYEFSTSTSIVGMAFYDSSLYLLTYHGDGLHIGRIVFGSSNTDAYGQFLIHLDRREDFPASTATYSGGKTTWTLGTNMIDAEDIAAIRVVISDAGSTNHGRLLPVTANTHGTYNTHTVSVDGDFRAYRVYIGLAYTMSFEFSTPMLRKQFNGREVGSVAGRWQLLYGTFVYADTARFDVRVTPYLRTAWTESYGSDTWSAQYTLDSGNKRVPILCLNTEATIEILNSSHLPCHIISAEWEGNYTVRAQPTR